MGITENHQKGKGPLSGKMVKNAKGQISQKTVKTLRTMQYMYMYVYVYQELQAMLAHESKIAMGELTCVIHVHV